MNIKKLKKFLMCSVFLTQFEMFLIGLFYSLKAKRLFKLFTTSRVHQYKLFILQPSMFLFSIAAKFQRYLLMG